MGEREERSYTDATAGLPVPKVTAEREVQPHLRTTSPPVQATVWLLVLRISPDSCLHCPGGAARMFDCCTVNRRSLLLPFAPACITRTLMSVDAYE